MTDRDCLLRFLSDLCGDLSANNRRPVLGRVGKDVYCVCVGGVPVVVGYAGEKDVLLPVGARFVVNCTNGQTTVLEL